MTFLVQVSGDLYLPVEECSAGELHYYSIDVDPVAVAVDSRTPLIPYLEMLIEDLRSAAYDQSERTNLLYKTEDDLLEVGLNGILNLRNPAFDFFVRGNKESRYRLNISPLDDHKRFGYSRDEISPISLGEKQLSRTTPVSDVFGAVEELEITYIGSPTCQFPPPSNDWDAVRLWASQEDERIKEKLKGELEPYFPNIDEIDDIFALRVLSALGSSSGLLDESDLVDSLRADGYGLKCEFEDTDYGRYSESDIGHALNYLMGKKLVKEVAVEGHIEGYIDASMWRRRIPDIKDRFINVDHLLDDPVNVGILLSLAEDGPGRTGDLYDSTKSLGLESEGTLEDKVTDRLGTLASQGVIRETHGVYEITDRHIRPTISPGQLVLAM